MTDKHDDGGPAHPCVKYEGQVGQTRVLMPGMSLRDYFAAQAMIEMVGEGPWDDSAVLAADAYAIADAMLAERRKERGDG